MKQGMGWVEPNSQELIPLSKHQLCNHTKKKGTCYLNKCYRLIRICEPHALSHFPQSCLFRIKEKRE